MPAWRIVVGGTAFLFLRGVSTISLKLLAFFITQQSMQIFHKMIEEWIQKALLQKVETSGKDREYVSLKSFCTLATEDIFGKAGSKEHEALSQFWANIHWQPVDKYCQRLERLGVKIGPNTEKEQTSGEREDRRIGKLTAITRARRARGRRALRERFRIASC